MFKVIQIGMLACVIAISSKSAWSMETAYVSCYPVRPAGWDFHPFRWEWAEVGSEKKVIHGYWVKDKVGNDFFMVGKELRTELTEVCQQSLRSKRGNGTIFHEFRARVSTHSQDYMVRQDYPMQFMDLESLDLLRGIRRRAQNLFGKDFNNQMYVLFQMAQGNEFLASLVEEYVRKNPKQRNVLHTYVEQAIQYSHPENSLQTPDTSSQMSWRTQGLSSRLIEFVDYFKDVPDFDILAYGLTGRNGETRRGPFNSFVDLTTDLFLPLDEKKSKELPSLFDPENSQHRSALIFLRLFEELGTIKRMLNALRLEKFGSEDVTAAFTSVLNELEATLQITDTLSNEVVDPDVWKGISRLKRQLMRLMTTSLEQVSVEKDPVRPAASTH